MFQQYIFHVFLQLLALFCIVEALQNCTAGYFKSEAIPVHVAFKTSSSHHIVSYAIAVDNQGNGYVTGAFTGNATFGTVVLNAASIATTDFFVYKYNSNGTFLWALRASGQSSDQGTGIAVDSQGNVYVAAKITTGMVTFGPSIVVNIAGTFDAVLIKLSSDGIVQWVKALGAPREAESGLVKVDNQGNLYFSGRFKDSITVNSFTLQSSATLFSNFLIKYNANGEAVFAKALSNFTSTSFDIDNYGNVLLTGTFTGIVQLDSFLLKTSGQSDVLVASLNPFGVTQCAKQTIGSLDDRVLGIAADDKHMYVTGYFKSPVISFDNITMIAEGSMSIFTGKFTHGCAIVWMKQISSSSGIGTSIATDATGNVYVSSRFGGVANIDNTISVNALSNLDLLIVKYSANGTVIDARKYGSFGWSTVTFDVIAATNAGVVYMAGNFLANVNFEQVTLLTIRTSIFNIIFKMGCSACLPGSYSAYGATSCIPCPMKTFADKSGSTMCKACVGGLYSGVGAAMCSSCPSGNKITVVQNNVVSASGIGSHIFSNNIAIDNEESVFALGTLGSQTFFGTRLVVGSGTRDAFLVKYFANSSLAWVALADGVVDINPKSMNIDALGFVHVIVQSLFAVTFGSITVQPLNTHNVYVAKYDTFGKAVAARTIIGSTAPFDSLVLKMDDAGNYLVAGVGVGVYNFTNTFVAPIASQIFVIKLDSNGELQWMKNSQGPRTKIVNGGCIDSAGNLIIVGLFSLNITFDNYTLFTSASYDNNVFIVKYDANGAVLWAKSAGGTTNDVGYAAACDPSSDSVYVIGSFGGTARFDSFTVTAGSPYNAFLAKYDANGNVAWVRTVLSNGYSNGFGITVDSSGQSIIFAGQFSGQASFRNALTLTSSINSAFVARYNAQGFCIWAQKFASVQTHSVSALAQSEQESGKITVFGSFSGALTVGNTTVLASGTSNLYVATITPICEFCKSGTFAAIADSTQCVSCAPGKFSSIGASDCSICAPGTFSLTGASECSLCTRGTSSFVAGAPSASFCNPCAVGSFSNQNGSALCQQCVAGTFASQAGSTFCELCPIGTFSNVPGLTSASQCTPCPLGTYSAVSGATSCTPCLQGTFNDMQGQSACKPCGRGTFLNMVGATSGALCQLCPSGTFSSTVGATSDAFCTACSIGSYSTIIGATNNTVCKLCEPGTYSNSYAASSPLQCLACESGKFSSFAGASQCYACQAGSYAGAGATTCQPCSPGFYSTTVAATSIATCTPCASGSYSTATGASQASTCQLCAIGTFSSSNGTVSCTQCSVGYFANVHGSTSCLPCAAGMYSTDLGATQCQYCPAGTFHSKEGSQSIVDCLPCSIGSFSTVLGAKNQSACLPCAAGTYSNSLGASSSSSCLACSPGTYSSRIGATTSSDCISCPLGYYSEQYGASSIAFCKPCPIGSFSNVFGATSVSSCFKCAPGSWNSNTGQSSCTLCSYGQASSALGAETDTCVNCPSGTYSDVMGSASCKLCVAGTFTLSVKSQQCYSCPAGTFSTVASATTNTTCKLCPEGTYSSQIGASSETACLYCAIGYYHKMKGASSSANCLPCNAGEYGLPNGSCASCPPGTYSFSIGATSIDTCLACAPGSFNAQHGQTSVESCFPCPLGTFSSTSRSVLCKPCSRGNFASKIGSTECTECPSQSICRAGASVPLQISNDNTSSVIVYDPYFTEQIISDSTNTKAATDGRIATITVFVIIGIILSIICGIIVLFLYKWDKTSVSKRLLPTIDFFSMHHYTRGNHPLVKHYTAFGGFMTLMYVCGIGAVISLLFIDLARNNRIVRSSIIPEQVVPNDFPVDVQGSFIIRFTLFNYNAQDCNTSAPISYIGLEATTQQAPFVTIVKHVQNATCELAWTCVNCRLNGNTQKIQFAWDYPFAMASHIRYSLLLPHFYDKSKAAKYPFLVQEQLMPPSPNQLFRGSLPTELSFALFKSYVPLASDYLFGNIFSKTSAKQLSQIGYVATKFPTRLGSTTSATDEFDNQGLFIAVEMSLNANVLMITEEGRSTFLEFISKLFALVGAVSAITAFAMSKSEQIVYLAKNKIFHRFSKRWNKENTSTDSNYVPFKDMVLEETPAK